MQLYAWCSFQLEPDPDRSTVVLLSSAKEESIVLTNATERLKHQMHQMLLTYTEYISNSGLYIFCCRALIIYLISYVIWYDVLVMRSSKIQASFKLELDQTLKFGANKVQPKKARTQTSTNAEIKEEWTTSKATTYGSTEGMETDVFTAGAKHNAREKANL